MDATFDHATIAVFDVDEAVQFFAVLGFEVTKSVRSRAPRWTPTWASPAWRPTT